MKIRSVFNLSLLAFALTCSRDSAACTISENMEQSLPLNSTFIPNATRLRIANMVVDAQQWLHVPPHRIEIRGIAYAGGSVLERNPKALAEQRAALLKAYLIQLGIKESNIWVETRIIRSPDRDSNDEPVLNQIAVSLVPICEGGCTRFCNDPGVTPNSRIVQ